MKDIKPGIYRHSKSGRLYRVIGIAKHTETLEPFVVYEPLYPSPETKIWIRPAVMFGDTVELEGGRVARFVFVREQE